MILLMALDKVVAMTIIRIAKTISMIIINTITLMQIIIVNLISNQKQLMWKFKFNEIMGYGYVR